MPVFILKSYFFTFCSSYVSTVTGMKIVIGVLIIILYIYFFSLNSNNILCLIEHSVKYRIFSHPGFLLGTRQTIMETKDGGNTWAPRSIPSAEDEDFNYRFNSISFKGKEGWIVGKPAILLYTSDAGESWERIPLSAQLPGDIVRTSS